MSEVRGVHVLLRSHPRDHDCSDVRLDLRRILHALGLGLEMRQGRLHLIHGVHLHVHTLPRVHLWGLCVCGGGLIVICCSYYAGAMCDNMKMITSASTILAVAKSRSKKDKSMCSQRRYLTASRRSSVFCLSSSSFKIVHLHTSGTSWPSHRRCKKCLTRTVVHNDLRRTLLEPVFHGYGNVLEVGPPNCSECRKSRDVVVGVPLPLHELFVCVEHVHLCQRAGQVPYLTATIAVRHLVTVCLEVRS